MKRLVVLIPLMAIVIGVFLLLRSRAQEMPAPQAQKAPILPAPAGSPSLTPGAGRAPAAARTGTIHLLVQSQGKGLAGAKVKVSAEAGPGKMEFTTDSAGFQTLHQVPVGEYAIEAAAPRHIVAHLHAVVTADRTTEVTLPLSLGSRLEGTVFDPAGRPAPGARLSLMNPPKGIAMSPLLSAESDAAGRYVIDGVPLADLDLHVYHARFKPWLKRDLPFRSPEVVLREDVLLQEGSRLTGRVLDERGAPIAQALVLASDGIPRGADSDAEGRFEISGLNAAAHVLTARARGFGTHYRQGVSPNGEPTEIRLKRAGSVDGSLEASPVPDVFQVLIHRLDPAQGREMTIDTRPFSGSKGAFRLPDLEPGTYRLEVRAEGYVSFDQPQVLVQEGSANPAVRIRLNRKN